MNDDTNYSDLPFPIRKNDAKARPPTVDAPLSADVPPLNGSDQAPLHGVHSFYEHGRSLIDERRTHLARVGMTPEQANALKMPDLQERPRAPPQLLGEDLPEPNKGKYARPKLPEHVGVQGQLEE